MKFEECWAIVFNGNQIFGVKHEIRNFRKGSQGIESTVGVEVVGHFECLGELLILSSAPFGQEFPGDLHPTDRSRVQSSEDGKACIVVAEFKAMKGDGDGAAKIDCADVGFRRGDDVHGEPLSDEVEAMGHGRKMGRLDFVLEGSL